MHTSEYAKIILRMGTFPTIMTLLAIIGKRFQDAGLHDTCIESGTIAEGSVSGVLAGWMYSRAVRVHTIIYEALLHLACKGFITWLEAHHPNQMHSVSALLNQVSDARECPNQSLTNYTQVMVWQSLWSYGINYFPPFATTMETCLPSGCQTWLVTYYLDWSARQEVAIGNCTCLPSGKYVHGTLPMTDWIMRDICQLTLLRWSTSRLTIHKFTNTSPMEGSLTSLLMTIQLVAFQ